MGTGQPTKIFLPAPSRKGSISLEEAISRRRSVRDFSPQPISQSQLSQILWAAQGITDTSRRYRAVPSAGATYPLEILVACGRNGIEEIGAGIYHYNVADHSLSLHHQGDVRLDLAKAALDEAMIYQAPVDIIICALYQRTTRHYGSRGERYVHMEAGHAGQNIYLEATALGREILRLDKQYKPLYIMPVGRLTTD